MRRITLCVRDAVWGAAAAQSLGAGFAGRHWQRLRNTRVTARDTALTTTMRRTFLTAALPALALAALGVDFAGSISSSTASCLVSQNQVSYGIVRAWHSSGSFDSGCVSATSALWSAGAESVDVYSA